MKRKLIPLLLALALVLMMVPAMQVGAEEGTTTIEWYIGLSSVGLSDCDMVNDAM